MELPPYRLPTWHGVCQPMMTRTRAFIRRAWTLILGASFVVWVLGAVPIRGDGHFAATPIENSAFAAISEWVRIPLEPLGFGSWQTAGALITGLVAKEVVVSTLAQLYSSDPLLPAESPPAPTSLTGEGYEIGRTFFLATWATLKSIPHIVGIDLLDTGGQTGDNVLRQSLRRAFHASSGGHEAFAAFAFLVFVLIYTPCVAAVAAERSELGWRWVILSVVGQLILAWFMAFCVFQWGILLVE